MKRKKRSHMNHKPHLTGIHYSKGRNLVHRVDDVITVNKIAQNDTAIQYMVDLFCVVLNDPEVMGKDVFGRNRLRKIILAVSNEYNNYRAIFKNGDEQDYYQELLDRRLRRIFGNDLVPFKKRYDWITESKY